MQLMFTRQEICDYVVVISFQVTEYSAKQKKFS